MANGVSLLQALRSRRGLWRAVVSLATVAFLIAFLWAVVLPLLFPWIIFLMAPFVSFTFTDPPDFIFVSLIALTLLAGLEMRHCELYSVKKASVAALVLSVLTPLVPMIFLYLLAHRGEELIGHWPQPWKDDPKYIGPHDLAYQRLFSAVIYASAFAGWGLITWGALMVHLWTRLSRWKLVGLAIVLVLAWWAFLLEPTQRFSWWLD